MIQLLVLVVLCHLFRFNEAKEDEGPNFHGIILHYHKTGNFLSRTLTTPFSAKNISVHVDNVHKRKSFDPSYFTKTSAEKVHPVTISRAGNFFFPWNDVLANNDQVQYRVAHMVRDPYDMVLSGFLYHSQQVMPEGWLGRNINPCVSNKQDMTQYLSIISKHPNGPSLETLQRYVQQVTTACQLIHREYSTDNYHRTLRSMLRRGRGDAALRMEAARAILSGDTCGADLLRMAANAIHENKANLENTSSRNFRRFWMSDFPLDDMDAFFRSAERFFEFLTHSSGAVPHSWRDKMPVAEYLLHLREDKLLKSLLESNTLPSPLPAARALRARSNVKPNRKKGLVLQGREEEAEVPLSASFQHVTQNLIPAENRSRYINGLRDDPAFAPLLDLIGSILLSSEEGGRDSSGEGLDI